jgi:hypothetical protein
MVGLTAVNSSASHLPLWCFSVSLSAHRGKAFNFGPDISVISKRQLLPE